VPRNPSKARCAVPGCRSAAKRPERAAETSRKAVSLAKHSEGNEEQPKGTGDPFLTLRRSGSSGCTSTAAGSWRTMARSWR
jgi:hypothetical protein